MGNKIIGYEKEKTQVNQLRTILLNSDEYRKLGIRIPRGLALCGEPGVGKTVLAKSIAGDGVNLIELKTADCCDGDVPRAIEGVFKLAKTRTPCVILVDELDKIAGYSHFVHDESNMAAGKALLNQLDSLSDQDKVLVVATCNDSDCLGEALLRPGRFDRMLTLSVPDAETRRGIIKEYFDKIKVDKDLDYDQIVRITSGYSGAKIECLANEVGIMALEKENPIITINDVITASERMELGGEAAENRLDEAGKYRLAVHEAGHCIITMILRPEDIVSVSIRSQGRSYGHSSTTGPEGRALTVTEKKNMIAEALGGHVAERVILNEYGLGCESDLFKAQAAARSLICRNGVYGYKYLVLNERMPLLISDSIASEITKLVSALLEEQDSRAASIIKENRALFDRIVDGLIDKQTLSKAELEEIALTVKNSVAA